MLYELIEKSIVSHEHLCEHKGRDKVWEMYLEIMTEDILYSISDLDKYYQVYPSTFKTWLDAYSINHKKKGKDIVVDSPKARELINSREYQDRYYIKLLPKSQYFAKAEFYDYLIAKDKVVIVKEKNNEISAVTIANPKIVKFSKEFFENIWNLLPDPEKY